MSANANNCTRPSEILLLGDCTSSKNDSTNGKSDGYIVCPKCLFHNAGAAKRHNNSICNTLFIDGHVDEGRLAKTINENDIFGHNKF